MKYSFKIIALILFISAAFFSCKKSTTDMPPLTPRGTFALHLHTDIDTSEIDSGGVGRDALGRQIQLNLAQFYFSNVTLISTDGISRGISGVFMKIIGQEVYLVGEAPAGNYAYFSFQVGLDNTTNQTLPSSYAAGNVLAPQNPPMWFGSTSQGYIFLNIQGYADTSAGNNGPLNQPLNYQIGTSTALKRVTMPLQAFTIVSNQVYVAHVIADYGVLLQNVNFKTQNNATTFSNPTVANSIASILPYIFRYE
jgi:hypothetical protein